MHARPYHYQELYSKARRWQAPPGKQVLHQWPTGRGQAPPRQEEHQKYDQQLFAAAEGSNYAPQHANFLHRAMRDFARSLNKRATQPQVGSACKTQRT